ncbi:MAG: polysaccharide biosynthesis C-terminal domain-containing protein [Chitinophagaceae bacterium]
MGIIKRQGLKSSILNYAGVFLGVVFFNFVFPNIIDEKYLGLIGLLRNITFIAATIPMMGLGHLLLNYDSTWKDKKMTDSFNAFALLISLLLCILFAVFYYAFRESIIAYYVEKSSLFNAYYIYVVPLVFLFVANSYFEIYSLAKKRTAVPAFLREVLNRILLILVFFLFIKNSITEQQFVSGFVLTYCIPLLILCFYAIQKLDFGVSSMQLFWNQKDRNQQLVYSFYMLVLVISMSASNFIDGVFIPSYLGLGALGIYMPSLVLGQMIQVPYRSITLISVPVIREAIVAHDYTTLNRINKSMGLNLFLIGAFLFTLLIVNSDNIFLMIPEKYSAAKYVLIIVALGRLIDMGFGINTELLVYSSYYKQIVLFSFIMMLSTISLNLVLLPRIGINGAAWAVSISLIVFNMLKSWLIYKKFHFHCFSKHYITLTILTLCIIAVLYMIPYITFLQQHMFINPLLNMIFKSIIAAVLFLVPVFFLKVSPDLNDFIKLILNGKLFKGGYKLDNL